MREITLGRSVQTLAYHSIYLGMDTEMVLKGKDGPVYPHEMGLSQTRMVSDNSYDWHGDGFAFELCTDPATCLDSLMTFISEGLHDLCGMSIMAPAVYEIPQSVLKVAPAEVRRLGCKPSLNAYDMPGDPDALPENLRTTGCHLHMSAGDYITPEVALVTTKWADVLVGTMWTAVSPNRCKDEKLRRMAYGRAGEYRTTRYLNGVPGVEYRVLPGTALLNPALLTLCFALYRESLVCALDHGAPPEKVSAKAVDIINNSRRAEAARFLWTLNWAPGAKKYVDFYIKYRPTTMDHDRLETAYSNIRGYRRYYTNHRCH